MATIRTVMEDDSGIRTNLERERERLRGVRDDLLGDGGVRGRSEQDDLSELSGVDQHQADVGTETFDRERDLSIVEQLESELGEVERALEKLDTGGYGLCEICASPIGADRLDALPAARFCLAHERSAEQDGQPGRLD